MEEVIPTEFTKVMKDFLRDLKTTFSEYKPFIDKLWKDEEQFSYIEEVDDRKRAYEKSEAKSMRTLFEFSKKKLPARFFDILYQNDEMFKEESDIDTEFLPKIHFKNLWQCDITDKTREIIWKYLQLILFSVVGTLENKDSFGDTAKLFEAINEEDFKSKLQETLSQMEGLFDMSGQDQNVPNAEQLNEHIAGMLDGKIGKLAREIAEETAQGLNMEFDDATDMKDIFGKLMKNPTKLMGLVKNIGNKLDSKLKSGELKESEMIEEATEIMNRMKDMPGMGNIQSMLGKMGLGGGGKVNTAAMEAQLNQRLKMAKTKERIRAKAEANAKAREAQKQQQTTMNTSSTQAISDEEIVKIFSSGEKAERTPRDQKKKGKGKK